MKRIIRAAAAASAVAGAALVFVPTAAAASNGIGGCQLNGTAKFGGSGLDGPPLYGPFSYSFDGKLSNCQSRRAGLIRWAGAASGAPCCLTFAT